MGRLIAKAYRTAMMGNLADHTYVECGAGAKAWGCWGGKTNGQLIGHGIGSTRRADAIAEIDERAGITCYGINGVCHQAANRILQPAHFEVSGARGYGLSKMLFGVFGRPTGPLGICSAPLEDYVDVSGDLDECADLGPDLRGFRPTAEELERWGIVVEETRALFSRAEASDPSADGRIRFQLAQVRIHVMNTMKGHSRHWSQVEDLQLLFEQMRVELEDELADGALERIVFADRFNRMTMEYQQRLAVVLPPAAYVSLLASAPGEFFVLCDPELFTPDPEPRFRDPQRGFRQG